MDLSNDLISQFAKLTTGDKDKNKEATVYGTVTMYDGKTCVKIDGSDLLTPVDTTAEVKEGERVTVLIKNHSAVIMGNTSDPSAGVSTTDKISQDVSTISADVGMFKDLTTENFQATNAVIQNLVAKDAEIENLVAEKATILELEAAKADIKQLHAEVAEIDEAVINKADIEDLKAAKADIDDLKADTAKINEALITKAEITMLEATWADIDSLEADIAEIDVVLADKATIEELDAVRAEISDLNVTELRATVADISQAVIGKADIEDLEAYSADIESLRADTARIDKALIDKASVVELEAAKADIKALNADMAEINDAVIGKADVSELEAAKADIKDLNAEMAEIDEALIGKANISELTSIRADIAILDSAVADIDYALIDKASVEDLNAEVARIDKAIVQKADIVDLNAQVGYLETIISEKATIEELDAVDANIKTLNSDVARIDEALINKANIADLNAANADIDILNTQVADIENLVGGNLTMDNMQSLNLTASKVTVDDAFIKDAMIDSITASKITAGVIDTNKIAIKSTDGSMLLSGSVQQFKDKNGKVRIQIGKDGGGNFTFVLYDETGKGVLIDEEGVKSSDALADGLIVDSKVADDANISGSKLDIASVITEVNNDNSTTIKSNKIFLDEQNQSLEVAFNSLKTEVETIKDITIDGDIEKVVEQVQSNTAQINANKSSISTLLSENTIIKEDIKSLDGEIDQVSTSMNDKYTSLQQDLSGFKTTVSQTYTSKTDFNNTMKNYSTTSAMNTAINQKANEITSSVSQTYATKTSVNDVNNDLKNNYSTTSAMNTAINQKANEITSSVSQTYATKSDVSNLSVGGKNLVGNSAPINTTDWRISNGWSISLVDCTTAPYSKAIRATATTAGTTGGIHKPPIDKSKFVNGDEYTISAWIRSSKQMRINFRQETMNVDNYVTVTTSWTYFKFTHSINTSAQYHSNVFYVSSDSNIAVGDWFEVHSLKLEKGNKATDWTPAPEDIDDKIYSAESKIEQASDSWAATFASSGGYNLIKNSTGNSSNTNQWVTSADSLTTGYNDSPTGSPNRYYLHMTNTNTAERYAQSARFRLKPNTTYRFTGYFHNYTACKSFDVFVFGSTTLAETDTSNVYDNDHVYNVLSGKSTNGQWVKYTATFTTKANVRTGYLRIDHNGYNSSGTNTSSLYWSAISLTQGEAEVPWSPHPDEVYSGITTIDASGIKVKQTGYNGYTHMAASGFYVNDGTTDVVKITKDGAVFTGKMVIQSGSTVPTSVLSGKVTSSQLDSTVTTDISTAKSNASTALSTANTAKSTANTANTNANTAKSNASTALSTANTAKTTADSVKATVDAGKANWNNAYNRVNEWAFGAVTGSTTIDGGLIESNTILAKHIAIGDFNNYSQLVKGKSLTSKYGTANWVTGSSSDPTHCYWNTTSGYFPFTVDGTPNPFTVDDKIQFKFDAYVSVAATKSVGVWFYSDNNSSTGLGSILSSVSFKTGWNNYVVDLTLSGDKIKQAKTIAILIQNGNNENLEVRNAVICRKVAGALIVDGAITAGKISSGAITTDKLAANAVTAAKIAANTITASQIASGAINTDKLAANAVTAAKIAANTITASQIASGAINTDELAANAVTAAKIAANTITANQIASGAITTDELASNAVTAAKIAAGSITTSKLAVKDGTNYAQLTDQTASSWGFTKESNSGNPYDCWYKMNAINRDTQISEYYPCNGGESLRVKADIATSIYGQATNGGTATATARGVTIMIFTQNTNDGRSYLAASRVTTTSTSTTAIATISSVITLPTEARRFAVYVQIDGYPTFTGAIKVRNVQVTKMSSGELIVDGSVTAGKISSNAVTTDKLNANAVTSAKIAANAITADKIAAGVISTDKLAANAVTAAKIAANTITASQIASGAINTDELAANAVTAAKIAANTITASQIASGAINTDELAANAVTAAKIAANTITAKQIASGAITTDELASNAVTAAKIAAGAITAEKIAAGAISADKITSGTLDASKVTVKNLSASSITTGTFSGNRISGGKISASEEIAFVGGARIFGTGGEAGAKLSISASEYSFTGASQGFLGGSWSIDTNLTVSGATKTKTLNVTSTSTLAGGVTCSSTLSVAGSTTLKSMSATRITASSTLSVSGTSTLTGAVSTGGNLKVAGTLELNNMSIWLGTRNETVTAAAIKFGTGGYIAAYSGFHFVQSNGNAHSLRAGTIYTNGTQVTSDRRKKMDIRYVNVDRQSIGESGRMAPNTNITIQDMHEFIGSLPLTSFRYIEEVEDNRNLTHYGFLTQDIMYTKVGSELVTMLDESKRIGDDEDYTGYSVEKLLMFVCGALQEEIHQRQLLEQEIKNLKEGK